VIFINCSFLNTTSVAPLGYLNRGTGIYSLRASFQIAGENDTYDGENDLTYTSFFQLEKAIEHAGNGFVNSTFSCTEMEFQLCNHGILNYTSDNIQVYLNNFLIPEIQANSGTPRGMFIANSTGYLVEQNNFYGYNDPEDNSPFPDAVGVWIFNSLGAANEIYNNHFDKLILGTYILKNNWGSSGQTGLEIKCNLYTENTIDVYRFMNSSTRHDQGNSPNLLNYSVLAGNRFSIPNFSDCQLATDWVIDPYNSQYNNYYCHDEALTIPDYCKLSTHPNPPLNNILLYSIVSTEINFDESHCPDHFFSGFTGGAQENLVEIESEIDALRSELNTAKANYALVVDDNQTSVIISSLDDAFPEESAYLRELLLQKLPLSDDVMHKMIQKANLFDPWHLTEVFLANAPLNKNLLKEIEEAEILSAFFMSFLDAADSGESLRRLMELNIRGMEELKYEKLKNLFMQSFNNALMDDAVWNIETYTDQLQNEEGSYLDRSRALSFAETNDFNAAFDLSSNNTEIDFLSDYLMLAQTLNNDWNTAQNQDIEVLWALSENEEHGASSLARAVLHYLDLSNSEPEPQLPIQFRSLSTSKKPEKIQLPLLGVVPNPAQNYTYIHYPIEADEHGLFQLYDNYGRLLQQWTPASKGLYYLDLQNFQSGLYHLRLSAFGKVVESLKLVIID